MIGEMPDERKNSSHTRIIREGDEMWKTTEHYLMNVINHTVKF
jgi:hypothetical protein